MPYSRHVGYLCSGITLSRRVITGKHAAPRSTRSLPRLPPRIHARTQRSSRPELSYHELFAWTHRM